MLALDFGRERTGVAVSDPSGTLASPREPVLRANSSEGLATISRMASELGVDCVVVGLPVGLRGVDTPQTARTRSFADRLAKAIDVPVVLHDERFTSKLADRSVAETGSATSRDSLAACHLLTSYLESVRP